MSLLKDLVKTGVSSAISKGVNGVSNGISQGISKGISNAVGSAVQKTVAPAADKLAGKAAEKMNETASALNKSLDETAAAANQAAEAMSQAAASADQAAGTAAPAAGNGFAALAGNLSGLMGSLEAAATEMASNVKVCPKCGEGAPATMKFCPKCGAALPEKTLGELYVCPKCGKKNLPDTKFCVECGEVLPIAAAEVEEQKKKDAEVLASWGKYMADYPVWNGGGSEFEINENGDQNGYPVYLFEAVGVDRPALDAYVALLKEAGFVRPEGAGSDETLFKVIGGVCRAFNQTEAIIDDRMTIGFFVGDYDKPKTASGSKVDSVMDGIAGAKKMFGKLFG